MATDKYKKGGLLLSENTLLLFDRMTDKEGFVFLKLIRNYHRDGTLPPSDTERLVSISFDLFKADYDASQKKYREKVARMLKNREKQEICETSQEICETSQEIESNTIHNNTSHNNTSKESKPKKDVSLPLSEYQSFLIWLNENCSHLKKMDVPTEVEYKDLLAKVGSKKELTNLLSDMDNRKDTAKKNHSIYRTALIWWRRDHKEGL